ncbi:hypothetical protein RRG08_033374 [Elysia crispata]|uniref:Uncharacterized protein n=1 Tax=Elysia crispata TaxID=231223 RepID=A0AAE0YXP5_9GAST|nr:hypothetical protein RRG08_033374 [Elysia crispata]
MITMDLQAVLMAPALEASALCYKTRVKYLDHTFFSRLFCWLKNIRPGRKAGDAQVADIRCLKYTPEGRILFKLVHKEDWKKLFAQGNSTHIDNQPL